MVWTGQHQAHEDKRECTCPVEWGGVVLLHESGNMCRAGFKNGELRERLFTENGEGAFKAAPH